MATWTQQSKNSSSFSNVSKNSSSFSNVSKNTSSYSNVSKNNSSFTNEDKSFVDTVATAGLYYGFGLFTYSGGQVLSTDLPTWTNVTKN